MPEPAPTALTIDELAQHVGMTVRNVRAYRSRGLLPEPELRGRKGYYGDDHVARLELIRDLKDRGFNLEAIGQIIDRAPGDSLREVLDFTRAVVAPLGDETPKIVSSRVFAERWGSQLTPEVVRRAERLGFVRRVGEDRWEVRSPRLERASTALSELGVPLEDALAIGALLKRHSRAVARAYVDLFTERVWRPFLEAGEPKEQWPAVQEALERLRPLAGESLLAVFQMEMMAAIEAALQSEAADSPGAPRRQARP
jgi:DNA-binding transcriptional MerR regulator